MSHDPAELVAHIPEPEASSVEEANEDSQNFLAGPQPTEDWVVSTANKFHFQPNSMLAFYPRHIRKVITKRKQAEQSFDEITQKLSKLKAPRHKNMKKKTLSKMRCLAISQMNMMQVVLQKVAYRSKDIQKQEKIVGEKLRRKRIQLESPNFNLMDVLHKSLLMAQNKNQAKQLAQKYKTLQSGVSDHQSIAPSTTGTRSTVDQ